MEGHDAKTISSKSRCTIQRQIEGSRTNHLVNLLSCRDVKEGFDRKPTTKDQNEIDLQGYTWRYAEKRGFDMSEITTR